MSEFESNLDILKRKGLLELGAALYRGCLIVELKSRARTPVLTGTLRATHETSEPEYNDSEKSVECTISVGGPAAPYALAVHENLNRYHRNGQAKFLESAVLESRDSILDDISKADLEKLI